MTKPDPSQALPAHGIHCVALSSTAIDEHPLQHEHRQKSPLRFIICGGEAAGKRTLLRQLLRASKGLAEEQQIAVLEPDHRCFRTERREFVVADPPRDHGRCTRHIVAHAPIADLALVLVDASQGMQEPTRRHIYLLSLVGIRQVVVAVNKMDLVGHSQAGFDKIEAECRAFAAQAGMEGVTVMPVSGLNGDNLVDNGPCMPWYSGPTLLGYLETVEVDGQRLPFTADPPAQVSDQFEATVVWLSKQPMLRGRSYLMKIGTQTATATLLPLKHKVNVNTMEHVAAEVLEVNEIGVAELTLDRPVAYNPYTADRDTGGFVLIDRLTHDAVGAGMLRFALRRADNIHWQSLDVSKDARRRLNGHGSVVMWLTGLSGAGKSAIANLLEKRLHALGKRTYLLDGDNVRHGLNKDLGFTAADRVENIRRVAEVAKLMVDAGVIVITAFISPFRAERRMARELLGEGEFIEVHVDTPLAVAERRDVKGLYKKARRGELKNFTGIDSPYEVPQRPEVRIDTTQVSVEEAVEQLLQTLKNFEVLGPASKTE